MPGVAADEVIFDARGVHPPWGHDAFPPVSDFPLFSKIFWLSGKFQKFDLFPKKFPLFIRQNFWRPFFSHRPQISDFSPIFPVLVHFPPDSQKLIIFPYFSKFPPLLSKNFSIFIHQNFWGLFFSHRPQISNFPPIFPVLVHFPPCFAKIIIFPLLSKISPCFRKIHLLFACFSVYFVSSYFDHDAFMHHPIELNWVYWQQGETDILQLCDSSIF